MFWPPIFFGTRGIGNPIKEHIEFVVQDCGDLEVPMQVLRLDGWPVGTLEDSPLAQTTLSGNYVSLFRTIKWRDAPGKTGYQVGVPQVCECAEGSTREDNCGIHCGPPP